MYKGSINLVVIGLNSFSLALMISGKRFRIKDVTINTIPIFFMEKASFILARYPIWMAGFFHDQNLNRLFSVALATDFWFLHHYNTIDNE